MSSSSRAGCEVLDRDDPLAPYRDLFVLPPEVIYLDGNSLGALPKSTAERVQRVVSEQWGGDLIASWNKHDWIDLPLRLGRAVADLIGAEAEEVIVCDSTSVNLFKLLAAAVGAHPRRRVIVSERDNFPTDLYMMQGLAGLLGDVELRAVARDEIASAIDDNTAVLALTHVDYRSGEIWDMAEITRLAQNRGALVLWDLAHSAGALPVDLNGCNADLAVGCGYKYLNGGPGAPAFLYVARRWQQSLPAVLSGWMGHAAPFEFSESYRPDPGIRRFACGTPPILSMSAMEVGVDILRRADMTEIRDKSRALGDLFLQLVEQRLPGVFEIACPRDSARRGSQVSLAHDQGYAIVRALIEAGAIGDFRAPNILRFGFAPLYLRFVDIWDAVERLHVIMQADAWDRPRFKQRAFVT